MVLLHTDSLATLASFCFTSGGKRLWADAWTFGSASLISIAGDLSARKISSIYSYFRHNYSLQRFKGADIILTISSNLLEIPDGSLKPRAFRFGTCNLPASCQVLQNQNKMWLSMHPSPVWWLLLTPSIHKYKMFWIFQYGLHTDWNEWTNTLKCVYIHPIQKKVRTSYNSECREYKLLQCSA